MHTYCIPFSSDLDEKYIVLIFENGLSMNEQMILEEILVDIGRTNNLPDFPSKLTFTEANVRLVQYNKAAKEKEKVKVQYSTLVRPGYSSIGSNLLVYTLCMHSAQYLAVKQIQ